jgi:hypothetical protein
MSTRLGRKELKVAKGPVLKIMGKLCYQLSMAGDGPLACIARGWKL